jgi:hypothetical protein
VLFALENPNLNHRKYALQPQSNTVKSITFRKQNMFPFPGERIIGTYSDVAVRES